MTSNHEATGRLVGRLPNPSERRPQTQATTSASSAEYQAEARLTASKLGSLVARIFRPANTRNKAASKRTRQVGTLVHPMAP